MSRSAENDVTIEYGHECYARLVLGDSRQYIDELRAIGGAVVTDVPYQINVTRMRLGNSTNRIYTGDNWDDDRAGSIWIAELSAPTIAWGGFNAGFPACRRILMWDKQTGDNGYSDFEAAWTNLPGANRVYRLQWIGYMARDGEFPERVHPTQKPVRLMQWCISFIPDDAVIIDPYMGSGTTGVACVNLGRSFVGIERDNVFFDHAKRRITEASRQLRMFN